MKKFVGIDLGGTDFKYGLYSENGDDLKQNGIIPAVRDNAQNTIDAISGIISKYSDIDGVGISMPGRVDKETGKIHCSGSLTVLWGIELRPIFEERHKLPFAFENDANSAALAELWLGNGIGCSNFICITIGTGIGGGIVINNQLHRGSHHFAGEFCFMYANPEPLEMFNDSSTYNLLKGINEKTSLKVKCGSDVFANLDKPDVLEVYNDWIKKLSIGIYNIGAAFDPTKILLGGGISVQKRIYHDIELAIQEVQHEWYPRFWTVEPCHFRNDAGKIGAVYSLTLIP
jgi:beta-glucoside kinase